MKSRQNNAIVVGRAGHDPATYGLKGRGNSETVSENIAALLNREPSVDQAQAFPPGCVVQLTSGMSKGLRGIVLGEARSMYLGVPDVAVELETGMVRPIRPDYLRRIG